MFKRLVVLMSAFLILFSSFAYSQNDSKMYHVIISQVEYDEATLITPLVVESGEYDVRFNTENLEGTYLMEFDCDYLWFDSNGSRLSVNPSNFRIIRVHRGVWSEVIRIGFNGKDNPLDLDSSWQTAYIIESYPGGEIHNAWYRKVFDENHRVVWKLVIRRRVK